MLPRLVLAPALALAALLPVVPPAAAYEVLCVGFVPTEDPRPLPAGLVMPKRVCVPMIVDPPVGT